MSLEWEGNREWHQPQNMATISVGNTSPSDDFTRITFKAVEKGTLIRISLSDKYQIQDDIAENLELIVSSDNAIELQKFLAIASTVVSKSVRATM